MINHNGYLMFHPDLRPVVSLVNSTSLIDVFRLFQLGPYRKQNYHSIDLDMVEIPHNLLKFVHVSFTSQFQN